MSATAAQHPPFGSVFADVMAIAWYRDGQWGPSSVVPLAPIPLHPAAHVLHYASECFEGFKAYRWADDRIHLFRMDRHLARFRQSAESLVMPVPEARFVGDMVTALIERCHAVVPEAPGALYLRPALIGTTANIGAAAAPSTEACLMVLASPVWDYFSGGAKPLKIWVEEHATRCASHLGCTKTGGNYAAALGPTMAARRAHQVDQVLFCPGGDVQETGAANFLLIREGHILTRHLDRSFLHGVTRDSLLTMAGDLGYRVEERAFSVDEMVQWVKTGEAALSGTAAVLAGVGSLQRAGETITVGDGQVGVHTQRLRSALVEIQQGRAPDRHGWLQTV